MNSLKSFQFNFLILIFIIQSISAPYPKYYVSDYCGLLKGSVIRLGESDRSSVALLKLKRETYKPNLDCNVTIKAPPNYGVIANIKKVKLRRSYPQEDMLQVSSDNKNTTHRWYGNNEEINPKVNIISNPNKGEINVIFKSEDFVLSLSSKGFKIVLTIYTPTNSNGKCGLNSSLSFNCANRLCISTILECDGINNCANYYDEQNCGATSESIIGVYVFMATLMVMVILIFVFMCRTKKDRHDIAKRLSKVYTNGGRRLSAMFSSDRRFSVNPEVINRSPASDVSINKSYASLPVIYQSIQEKQLADQDIINNINITSTNN